MKCNCEENCIKSIDDINDTLKNIYKPCSKCNRKTLKKAIPIKRQIDLDLINKDYNRCSSCNKRHIDYVMVQILKILIKNNLANDNYSIRKVGTPLINPGIYLESLPYLHQKSLVIIMDNINKQAAQEIYDEIPEIKAVLKGNIKETVGQITKNHKIHNYEVLVGCDIRYDIQETSHGQLYLYKSQSKIHIEYPKKSSQKIEDLDSILSKYKNPTVIDATCGCGTLGIYAIKKNAKKVIFNDIYPHAIDSLKVNVEINKCEDSLYEIYNLDMDDLVDIVDETYDIGIIDNFPGIESVRQKEKLEKICKEVIII